MIEIITDESEIHSFHKMFHENLQRYSSEKISCWVGYPGGNFPDDVLYFPQLDIWISKQEHDSRFWNGFGLGRPIAEANNSLCGEINFPYKSIDRRISGVFAKENGKKIIVLHRGRIGGGKPGIGKKLFVENFRGDKIYAEDGNRVSEFCLVGELNSPFFGKQIATFISEIKRVKSMTDSEINFNEEFKDFKYTDEAVGEILTEGQERRSINRIHGLVVKALAEAIKGYGFKVGNDKHRDLFIHDGEKIRSLFEIKISSSTHDLYTAIGQLLVYSMPINNQVQLFMVLPEKLNKNIVRKLRKLGIKVIYYKWQGDVPEFIDLKRCFDSI